jgi:hypothetical protein
MPLAVFLATVTFSAMEATPLDNWRGGVSALGVFAEAT